DQLHESSDRTLSGCSEKQGRNWSFESSSRKRRHRKLQISCQVAGEACWGFRLFPANRRDGSVQLNASRDEKDAISFLKETRERYTRSANRLLRRFQSGRNDEGWKKGRRAERKKHETRERPKDRRGVYAACNVRTFYAVPILIRLLEGQEGSKGVGDVHRSRDALSSPIFAATESTRPGFISSTLDSREISAIQ
ncbi:hypothetical protein K0M31_014706, partial [Melipona bicolor]